MNTPQRLLALWQANRWLPLLCLFLLLANLGVYGWSSRTVLPRLQKIEARFLQLQNEVRMARQLAASSGDPISQAERGKKDLDRFRRLIPAREAFDLLIGELFAFADEAGLQIARVTYRPKTLAEQETLKYGLDFAVAGDYQQLKQFLSLLEGSERLISVNRLSLGPGGESEVSLKLSLATYFRQEKS